MKKIIGPVLIVVGIGKGGIGDFSFVAMLHLANPFPDRINTDLREHDHAENQADGYPGDIENFQEGPHICPYQSIAISLQVGATPRAVPYPRGSGTKCNSLN